MTIFYEEMLNVISTPKILSAEGLEDCMSEFAAKLAPEAQNHEAKISARIINFLDG
jgi:hypothetical protein